MPMKYKTCEVEGKSAEQIISSHSSSNKRKVRILLAEDSSDNRTLISYYLKGKDIELDFAENGRQAIDLYCKNEYDLILMDIQMPDIDGYEAAKKIREYESEKKDKSHIPMLALTGNALVDEQEKSLTSGCDAHLTKPVRKQQLLDALAKALPSLYEMLK